jgi:N6-L-threonylcarbamoyladenine synthase
MKPANITVLGIESSCDETAAAVFNTQDGVRSNVLFSQVAAHATYGGVVPELASRSHLEKINSIVDAALERANTTLDEIDVIAVTNKPGLAGSLLVGLCFAKAVAYGKNKKFIGVNHLEGHAFSASIENKVPFPHLCMTASGGHTALYLIEDYGNYKLLGQTVDDAAGEAFDKIAKLLGLEYPGGPLIEKLAQQVNFVDTMQYPRLKNRDLNFSFSGLKTAVLYDLVKRGAYDLKEKRLLIHDVELKQQVASSLLVCIADIFEDRIKQALKLYPTVQAITFVGGVACNAYIRERLNKLAFRYKKQFFTPSRQYCTDNGAMIAFVGHYKAQQGLFSPLTLDVFE